MARHRVQPSLLKDEHRRALNQKIEDGPNPATEGVVRCRLIDLAQWILEDYRISVTKQILSRELCAIGYRKLSARPHHHAQDAALAAFKNVWPAPFASDFAIWSCQSATTYPVSGR
jgi:hypothetical protein